MNRKVRLFLIVNVALQLGMGLLLLTRGISPVWLIPYVVGILIANIFAYQIFYLQPRRVRDELHRVVEEQSWVDFLKPHEPDHDLRDLIRPLLKAYSRSLHREHSMQIMDKQVQIGVLQSQINPHFLYNTMESIRGQALADGSPEIARMAEALSSFFRYSIDQKGNIVTLQDELTNIRNYMFIQQYRFQDKFGLKVQVDEDDGDIYEYLLPKLTIQPIVENAIYHGLEMKSGPGRVSVIVNATPKRLLIHISDDGIGMSADVLADLNDRLHLLRPDAGAAKDQQSTGLALINVNRRIKLIFGNEYGIYVYSTLNKGTDVEIVLPLIKEHKNLLEVMEGEGTSPA